MNDFKTNYGLLMKFNVKLTLLNESCLEILSKITNKDGTVTSNA